MVEVTVYDVHFITPGVSLWFSETEQHRPRGSRIHHVFGNLFSLLTSENDFQPYSTITNHDYLAY